MWTERKTRLSLVAAVVACAALTWIATASSQDERPRSPETPKTTASLGFEDSLLIQLRVADLDRAISFYRDVLGFELFLRNDELAWAKLRTAVRNVVIGVGVSDAPQGSGTLSLNFSVANIEDARRRLEERGVKFTGPTITIPGVVKLADFADPDGNRIRLAGAP